MRNIWTDDTYIFKATTSGVNIYDIDTGGTVAIVQYGTGMSSVWSDDTYLYMGTTNSGVLWLPISVISGTYDLTNQLSIYRGYPNITNDHVNYLHGSGDYLCITTISGVDHINLTTSSGIYTTVSGAKKCYQTAEGRFYYCFDDDLNVVYDNTQNWTNPGYIYSVGDGIIQAGVEINDIFVTEDTSIYQSDDNVIFLATSNGVTIIEERKNNEISSRVKYFYKEF